MTELTLLYSSLFEGDPQEKLARAQMVWRCHGRELLGQAEFVSGVEELLAREKELTSQMRSMEMHHTCSHCGSRPGGGCCSLYMAGETDVIQLLMNMMAGVTVEMVNRDGVECCYLGGQGCILPLKPMFCLNYNCEQIQQQSGLEELDRLDQLSGALLQAQHELEKKLIDFLRERDLQLVRE